MSVQEKLKNQISFQFYTGSRLLQRMYRPYFDEWGITYSQYLVLECLWVHDGQTIADLSEPLDLDSGTLSPLLKRMETSGLVRRRTDESDYRRVVFTLTTKAKRMKSKAESMLKDVEQELGLDSQDLEKIQQIMAKINPTP